LGRLIFDYCFFDFAVALISGGRGFVHFNSVFGCFGILKPVFPHRRLRHIV